MRKFRHIRPPTPEILAKAAYVYLGRYAASEVLLRRMLENRLRRAALHDRVFAADKNAQYKLRLAIENIVEKHRKTGALNDTAYAETKVNSLRRSGRSARAITQRLGHAGVGKDIIKDALAGDADGADPREVEMKAARELARRRRLGPFRAGETDLIRFRKDLAVLARAGFPLDIARRVLGGQCASGDDDAEGFSAK